MCFPLSFRVIVSDYDRTLTDEGLNLFYPILSIIKALKRKFKFLLASGRRLEFFFDKPYLLSLLDAVIAENGGLLYLPKDGLILTFGLEEARKIKEALSDIPREEGKVVVSVKRERDEEVKKILRERKISANLEYNRDSLMLLPLGINKAYALNKVLGTEEKILVIGDGENDLSLFERASIKVATGDAVKEVKDKADFVCLEPCAYGVYRLLQDILLRC